MSAALLAGACGSRDDEPPVAPRDAVQPVRASDAVPASYALADWDCQEADGTVALTRAAVHRWDGERVVELPVTLTGVRTTTSLVSPAVRQTTFDDRYERTCDYERGAGHVCPDQSGAEKPWRETRPLAPLRVCKDASDFPRGTYERVALASIHGIERASQLYRAVDRGARPLEPVRLSVLPHFVDYYDNFPHPSGKVRLKAWITNNMAYFPGPRMIAVFPAERTTAKTATGFFWESPFVLAHEYGHHVELTRGKAPAAAFGLAWSSLEHRYVTADAPRAVSSGLGAESIFGAYSEGYADLLAYYAEGASAASLVGLPCFGKNRDPSRSAFANGDLKALTADRLAQLLGPALGSLCGEPDYSNIHTAGAMIAHLLDRSLEGLALAGGEAEPGSLEDVQRRYALALRWLDRMTARAKELAKDPGTSTQDLLNLLPDALEDAADGWLGGLGLTDGGRAAQKELCEAVRELMPAASRRPFADDAGGC